MKNNISMLIQSLEKQYEDIKEYINNPELLEEMLYQDTDVNTEVYYQEGWYDALAFIIDILKGMLV